MKIIFHELSQRSAASCNPELIVHYILIKSFALACKIYGLPNAGNISNNLASLHTKLIHTAPKCHSFHSPTPVPYCTAAYLHANPFRFVVKYNLRAANYALLTISLQLKHDLYSFYLRYFIIIVMSSAKASPLSVAIRSAPASIIAHSNNNANCEQWEMISRLSSRYIELRRVIWF